MEIKKPNIFSTLSRHAVLQFNKFLYLIFLLREFYLSLRSLFPFLGVFEELGCKRSFKLLPEES